VPSAEGGPVSDPLERCRSLPPFDPEEEKESAETCEVHSMTGTGTGTGTGQSGRGLPHLGRLQESGRRSGEEVGDRIQDWSRVEYQWTCATALT